MSLSRFWNLFPVPQYLEMSSVGLDISDQSVKYVQLDKKGESLFVKKFNNKPIPKGLIEGGDIKQKDKLIDFLKTIREEIDTNCVAVSLPEEKGFLSQVEIPDVKEEDIRGVLELQLENYIPLSGYDAVFDYEIIKRTTEGEKKGFLVNLTAFPATLVGDYRDVLMGAGFKPQSFEMETNSLFRAVVKNDDNSAQMIVDFGKTRTSFVVVKDQKIQFTSTIGVAGDSLTAAIAKDFGVDFFQAERIKKEYGFIKNKEYEKFFNSLLPLIGVIKDEMNKHINYWNTHMTTPGSKNEDIKKIILSGGDSSLEGFLDFLSYQLRMPVEMANPWINIIDFDEHIPEIDLREALMYSGALGLALRPFIKTKK
jgi:type IV pilus assembly protein PilM